MGAARRAARPRHTRIAGAGAAGFAGNILVGGIVGMTVDAASGATLEHYPNPVMLNLVRRDVMKARYAAAERRRERMKENPITRKRNQASAGKKDSPKVKSERTISTEISGGNRDRERPQEVRPGGTGMLQKLGDHIAAALAHAAAAEQRRGDASDACLRDEYEALAKGWRGVAESYMLVEVLERFLLDGRMSRDPPPSHMEAAE